ncbi:DnaD domain-containing protein [Macrococcoides bohemicum]|uniref:DnaD domain-containing protein n=1 Tax=Macrococcoides bohemicum TaxID=1903056 RepID=UPI00165D6FD9|nr:DnaD domain protein [Macrococcus bohemicus]MBC9873667.1 DnaD domain protein [Macrococcus bohemicus]
MSKLLIHDYPIQVSPKLAVAIGLNEAIMVQQMHYWLDRSSHFIENRKWIYNTYEGWRKQLPFWSESTIKRTITTLKKKGVIITGNFNKAKFDKTIWYSIDYEVIKQIEEQFYASGQNDLIDNNADKQWSNRTGQNDLTIRSERTFPSGQNDLTNGSKRTDGEGQNDTTNTIDYTETTTEITQETTPPEKKAVAVDDELFAKIYNFYTQNIDQTPNNSIIDSMKYDLNEFGYDLTMYAMKIAANNKATRYGYIESIFKRCRVENIKTVEQAELKAQEKARKNGNYRNQESREMTPKWVNNDTQISENNEVSLELYLEAKKEIYELTEKEWTEDAIEKFTEEYNKIYKKGA